MRKSKSRWSWQSVIGRLGLSRKKKGQRPVHLRRRSAMIEHLEVRQLLSVAPLKTWVNDNWVDQTHPGAGTPTCGDTMTAPAGETAPNLGSGTLSYGVNAFNTIQGGVDAVAGGGTVYVLPGTYTESDISLDKAVTVTGPATGTATVVPAVADSHEVNRDDWFGSGTHNAFVIRSSDVALSNLTIDGGTSYNYFYGVETDWTNNQTYSALPAAV
jgi:hypothetical protein